MGPETKPSGPICVVVIFRSAAAARVASTQAKANTQARIGNCQCSRNSAGKSNAGQRPELPGNETAQQLSGDAAPGGELNDQDDYGGYKQEPEPRADRVGPDQTQDPGNQQDREDKPQHLSPLPFAAVPLLLEGAGCKR